MCLFVLLTLQVKIKDGWVFINALILTAVVKKQFYEKHCLEQRLLNSTNLGSKF